MSPVADARQISGMIPHRFPIMLVDEVREVEPGRRLVARKAITVNEPWYAGICPDSPASDTAYPAPLLVESWAQAAVVLAAWETPTSDVLSGKIDLAGAVERVVFHREVFPGETLEHHVRLVRAVGDTAILAGDTATIGGAPVLTIGHFVVALRPVEAVLEARSRRKETLT